MGHPRLMWVASVSKLGEGLEPDVLKTAGESFILPPSSWIGPDPKVTSTRSI